MKLRGQPQQSRQIACAFGHLGMVVPLDNDRLKAQVAEWVSQVFTFCGVTFSSVEGEIQTRNICRGKEVGAIGTWDTYVCGYGHE